MKKILPLLMVCSLGLILPSVVLTNKTNSTSAETATVITHLVLTENGLYNGEAGKNNSELYLENTVAYEAAVGSELPGSDVITNASCYRAEPSENRCEGTADCKQR